MRPDGIKRWCNTHRRGEQVHAGKGASTVCGRLIPTSPRSWLVVDDTIKLTCEGCAAKLREIDANKESPRDQSPTRLVTAA